MIRRPPRSTRVRSSAASDVYKRQFHDCLKPQLKGNVTSFAHTEDINTQICRRRRRRGNRTLGAWSSTQFIGIDDKRSLGSLRAQNFTSNEVHDKSMTCTQATADSNGSGAP